MNIAALVSGGVDSSVTIPILKEMGYNPVIFYIKIAMENESGQTLTTTVQYKTATIPAAS